ncbi:hypothetical protein [Sphingobium sp.]|uniref:hypothetical protein n=1 Tax=Sphingobium sp. TaxID=1912891 RepID=UPI002E1DF0BE
MITKQHIIIVGIFVLASCNQAENKTQPSETIGLLRSGSEKVCVTDDVKHTLKDILLPKPQMIEYDTEIEEKTSALSLYSLKFNYTTMDAFDKSSSKASCNTTLVISGPNGSESEEFTQEYAISPSSDDPSSFVISAPAQAARAYIVEHVTSYLAQNAEQAIRVKEQSEQEAVTRATVNKRWIAGRWAPENENAYGCGEILEIEFGSDGSFSADRTVGTWKIENQTIIVNSVDAAENEDNSTQYKISSASENSFSYTEDDGSTVTMNRCS